MNTTGRLASWLTRAFGVLDRWLVALILVLCVISLMVVYSASNQSLDKLGTKLITTLFALLMMWLLALIHPDHLKTLAPVFYGLALALLVAVALFGYRANGSQRWLNLGFTRIQPSEMMKIALPLMLAWYFDLNELRLSLRHFCLATLLIALPVGLILKQPDLGTALLVMATGLFILFLAGLSRRVIVSLLTLALIVLPLWWHYFARSYQKQRILTFLDPNLDPQGSGYHTIQSVIAIGSGGFWGKGWLKGGQTHLDFIPESVTDFIFAVYGEEFGFIGNVVLLLIYFGILWRGRQMTTRAPDVFGRLLCGSLTLSFFTYIAVNMGMVSGILPVVGVPLPLISYGGTATLSILCGFGLMMAVYRHKKLMKS